MAFDGVRGLANDGNTCFLNSTLQALASVVPMHDYLSGVMEASNLYRTSEARAYGQTSLHSEAVRHALATCFGAVAHNDFSGLTDVHLEKQLRFQEDADVGGAAGRILALLQALSYSFDAEEHLTGPQAIRVLSANVSLGVFGAAFEDGSQHDATELLTRLLQVLDDDGVKEYVRELSAEVRMSHFSGRLLAQEAATTTPYFSSRAVMSKASLSLSRTGPHARSSFAARMAEAAVVAAGDSLAATARSASGDCRCASAGAASSNEKSDSLHGASQFSTAAAAASTSGQSNGRRVVRSSAARHSVLQQVAEHVVDPFGGRVIERVYCSTCASATAAAAASAIAAAPPPALADTIPTALTRDDVVVGSALLAAPTPAKTPCSASSLGAAASVGSASSSPDPSAASPATPLTSPLRRGRNGGAASSALTTGSRPSTQLPSLRPWQVSAFQLLIVQPRWPESRLRSSRLGYGLGFSLSGTGGAAAAASSSSSSLALTLEHCLEAEFQTERLPSDYVCDGAAALPHVPHACVKQKRIALAPAALCIHVNRLGSARKSHARVEFDTTLDLAPFMGPTAAAAASPSTAAGIASSAAEAAIKSVLGGGGGNGGGGGDEMGRTRPMSTLSTSSFASARSTEEPARPPRKSADISNAGTSSSSGSGSNMINTIDGGRCAADASVSAALATSYELVSVIEHLGGAGGGHYVTYRRVAVPVITPSRDIAAAATTSLSAPRWVRVSDATVVPVSLDDVLGAEAYMLFYVRRDRFCGLVDDARCEVMVAAPPSAASMRLGGVTRCMLVRAAPRPSMVPLQVVASSSSRKLTGGPGGAPLRGLRGEEKNEDEDDAGAPTLFCIPSCTLSPTTSLF